MNKIDKEKEYMKYINTHIENVKKAFKSFMDTNAENTTDRDLQEAITYLTDNKVIENHDQSKFSDEEFDAYRRYFYFVDPSEKNEDDFNKAWEHHYTVNEHHPEHWILPDGTYKEMPLYAIIEMICDWEAMSYTFGGSSYEYYKKNKADKDAVMNPITIEKLEKYIKTFM